MKKEEDNIINGSQNFWETRKKNRNGETSRTKTYTDNYLKTENYGTSRTEKIMDNLEIRNRKIKNDTKNKSQV